MPFIRGSICQPPGGLGGNPSAGGMRHASGMREALWWIMITVQGRGPGMSRSLIMSFSVIVCVRWNDDACNAGDDNACTAGNDDCSRVCDGVRDYSGAGGGWWQARASASENGYGEEQREANGGESHDEHDLTGCRSN